MAFKQALIAGACTLAPAKGSRASACHHQTDGTLYDRADMQERVVNAEGRDVIA